MDIVMSEELKKEMKDAQIAWYFNQDEDSKIPALFIRDDYTQLSIYKNGVSYSLNSKYGYTATAFKSDIKHINDITTIFMLCINCISENTGYTWQLSKKEFIYAKKIALELLKNCSDEYKRICLDVIDKLDYEEGYNNARFSINPYSHEKERILIIRFHYKCLFYDWNLENNTLTRANIDDPFANLNEKEIKGLEKKLILRTMHKSRALDKKIGEFYNK